MKRVFRSLAIPVTTHKNTSVLTTPCPAGKSCMVASGACNDCPSRADFKRVDVDTVSCAKRINRPPDVLYSNPFTRGLR